LIDMNERINRNQGIIDEFRANDGKVGGRFEGKTLLLLHTKGAKSGKERVNPVAYVRDGDRSVVIASTRALRWKLAHKRSQSRRGSLKNRSGRACITRWSR
jgi:hypothetical protein